MKYTAGQFNRNDWPVYFLAGGPGTLESAAQSAGAMLIAVNELMGESGPGLLEQMLDSGQKVFLDSGVFSLASKTAKERGITHDEALSLPLDQLSGFNDLYNAYLQLTSAFGNRLWGYIELDLGGREQKRETRAKLEAAGLQPIPVYHPLNDGWDYFDELASEYDRICIGNIVQASGYVRHRLLATVFERQANYPDLWIHLLGYTPNEWLNACPIQSCDSSTWLQTDGMAIGSGACCVRLGRCRKTISTSLGIGRRGKWGGAWARMGAGCAP